eukprot:601457-Alexandrium_andersonii.AAC.1
MSASLVGSEMCIRDRPAVGPPRRRLRSLVLRRGLVALRPRLPRQTAGPVSYTHLTLPTICSV